MDIIEFNEYLENNNGKILKQEINNVKIEFPAGIMEFKYINNNWEVILSNILNNLRKIDIEFMQKAIYYLEQIQGKEDNMKELQIGEYVRTNDGKIDKILNYSIGCNIWHCENGMCIDECNCIGVHLKDITKHSKNIIDLIEVGDIIEWEYKKLGYYGINEVINRFGIIGVYGIEYDNVISLKYIAIKRILTHEQYESNCYRIGE